MPRPAGARGRRSRSVAELLRGSRGQLTPAELRVAQTLLADYPAAGLQPVAALAERAGVSGPTVVRFVAKLGFANFAELQSRLRAELSARTAGPAQRYPDSALPEAGSPLLRRFEQGVGRAVTDTLRQLDAVEFEAAVQLVAGPGRRVLVTGGRVSSVHAQYLASTLSLLRPDVGYVAPERAVRGAALLDVDPASVAVIFDYRRYDDEVVRFGRDVVAGGGTVLLLTDPYLSPLAGSAQVLLTSAVDGPPPFITLAPAMAIVEALVAGVVEQLGAPARRRLERFDALHADLSAAP